MLFHAHSLRLLYSMPIQNHANAHKYVTHACMKEHILEHLYGEKP